MKKQIKFENSKRTYFSNFTLKTFRYPLMTATILRNKNLLFLKKLFIRIFFLLNRKITPLIDKNVALLLKSFSKIYKRQGLTGLVLYLKNTTVSFQQSLAGHKGSVLLPRVSRTKSGLPRIVPKRFRYLIRRGDLGIARLVMTMLSVFRDISIPRKLKLSTITNPRVGKFKYERTIYKYIPRFVKLFDFYGLGRKPLEFSPFPISKSSPTAFRDDTNVVLGSTEPDVLIRSAFALTPNQMKYISILENFIKIPKQELTSLIYEVKESTKRRLLNSIRYYPITGKISFKEEAAGKLRGFAMVDGWSQLLLRPIHDRIFLILSRHKDIDGTFDQLNPLSNLSSLKGMYSLDLSAATDRLPLSLQKKLLKETFGMPQDVVDSWSGLLVDRDYYLSNFDGLVSSYNLDPHSKKFVRYSVGQPMGALSSWGMLALTHHLILQAAAWEVGHSPKSLFRDYALLGDDIVINDNKVARKYLSLIRGLGVECNPSKSIISKRGLGLEFAKRTVIRGIDISPITLKEFYSSLNDLTVWASFVKKYGTTQLNSLKSAGFGYKVLGSINSSPKIINHKIRILSFMDFLDSPQRAVASLSFLKLRPVHIVNILNKYRENLVSRLNNQRLRIEKFIVPRELTLTSRYVGMTEIYRKILVWIYSPNIWEAKSNISLAYVRKDFFKPQRPMTPSSPLDFALIKRILYGIWDCLESLSLLSKYKTVEEMLLFDRSPTYIKEPKVHSFLEMAKDYKRMFRSLPSRGTDNVRRGAFKSPLYTNSKRWFSTTPIRPLPVLPFWRRSISYVFKLSWKRLIWNFVKRRVLLTGKWVIGYTALWALLIVFIGLKPTLIFVQSIFASVQALINTLDPILPFSISEWGIEYLFLMVKWLGGFIFSTLLVSFWWNWDIVYQIWEVGYRDYNNWAQLHPITDLWSVLDFIKTAGYLTWQGLVIFKDYTFLWAFDQGTLVVDHVLTLVRNHPDPFMKMTGVTIIGGLFYLWMWSLMRLLGLW